MKLREALKGKLTKKEVAHLRAAFDIIGSIAIIEIPDELIKKEKIIAETATNVPVPRCVVTTPRISNSR